MRLAVPNKGRLSAKTLELLQRAGIRVHLQGERQLFARTDHDLGIYFTRTADIPGFVAEGVVDLGIVGLDVLKEHESTCREILDLGYGACRLVVAVPEESALREGGLKPGSRVATSFPRLARAHFASQGLEVHVIQVSGATELTPHLGIADAIVDLVSSGSTLAVNGLVETQEILRSTARLVAHPDVVRDRGAEVQKFSAQLASVVQAEGRRYLMANVPTDRLDDARRILPGLNGPTILDVAHAGLKAVHAVVDERRVNATIEALQEIGAHGILVLPIERVVV
ncbi:MAG: ATP phosphoribosyltransferase [Thermoplasmatota archaeon]